MIYKQVHLLPKKEESLLRRHPWIFSGALSNIDKDIKEGDTIRVLNSNNEYLATGHYERGSIAIRILSFEDEIIDKAFYVAKLRQALCVREHINLYFDTNDNTGNNILRLVHGEGDDLSGLIIDLYGTLAIVQAHSIGMHRARYDVASALKEVLKDRVTAVYYKSITTAPYTQDYNLSNGFLLGNTEDNIASESGLHFHIDWRRGQKTGFFIDQRENRRLVEVYSKHRRVLNMFCYTGGFSLYAIRGGALLVHSVDSSERALELAKANVELNFPNNKRHKVICSDAFEYLSKSEEHYNLIILDPPAFAKHRSATHNALKGYIRLNAKALEKIEHGGLLFTFSCSQAITNTQFYNAIFTASIVARRQVRILKKLHQGADHPVNIYHPEGEYLKGLMLYVE